MFGPDDVSRTSCENSPTRAARTKLRHSFLTALGERTHFSAEYVSALKLGAKQLKWLVVINPQSLSPCALQRHASTSLPEKDATWTQAGESLFAATASTTVLYPEKHLCEAICEPSCVSQVESHTENSAHGCMGVQYKQDFSCVEQRCKHTSLHNKKIIFCFAAPSEFQDRLWLGCSIPLTYYISSTCSYSLPHCLL